MADWPGQLASTAPSPVYLRLGPSTLLLNEARVCNESTQRISGSRKCDNRDIARVRLQEVEACIWTLSRSRWPADLVPVYETNAIHDTPRVPGSASDRYKTQFRFGVHTIDRRTYLRPQAWRRTTPAPGSLRPLPRLRTLHTDQLRMTDKLANCPRSTLTLASSQYTSSPIPPPYHRAQDPPHSSQPQPISLLP